MSIANNDDSYFSEEEDNDDEINSVDDEVEEEADEEEEDEEEANKKDGDIEEEEDGDIEEEEDGEGEENDEVITSQTGGVTKIKKIPGKTVHNTDVDDDDDDDDGEMYLQKFNKDVNDNYIVNFHPECVLHNYDEILAMIQVVRDADDIIIDDLHKSIPYLTKYEKARILGQRAKQINSGSTPFVKVPENIIDGYLIAEIELKEKRIPFIIRRPLPNGGSEYWSIRDLENIIF